MSDDEGSVVGQGRVPHTLPEVMQLREEFMRQLEALGRPVDAVRLEDGRVWRWDPSSRASPSACWALRGQLGSERQYLCMCCYLENEAVEDGQGLCGKGHRSVWYHLLKEHEDIIAGCLTPGWVDEILRKRSGKKTGSSPTKGPGSETAPGGSSSQTASRAGEASSSTLLPVSTNPSPQQNQPPNAPEQPVKAEAEEEVEVEVLSEKSPGASALASATPLADAADASVKREAAAEVGESKEAVQSALPSAPAQSEPSHASHSPAPPPKKAAKRQGADARLLDLKKQRIEQQAKVIELQIEREKKLVELMDIEIKQEINKLPN